MDGKVELHVQDKEYVLLQPGNYPPRQGKYYNRICQWYDVEHVLNSASKSEYVALDLETRGSDYSRSDLEIIGIGLAWDRGSCYIPYINLYDQTRKQLLDFIYSHSGLLAHNVYYDGGVLYSLYNRHANWAFCTYALYRQLANEGWTGQKWGLKEAQVDLLGWSETNEIELDRWLIVNGHYRGNRLRDESPDNLLDAARRGVIRPNKAEMWRAPTEILGKYCCLDAESTYLLFTSILYPALSRFPVLEKHHRSEFMKLIRLHIEQKIAGIEVDRPGLEKRRDTLISLIEEAEARFRSQKEIREHLPTLEVEMLAELVNKEPEKYIKQKPLSKEPPKYRKDGKVSRNWIKWNERKLEIESTGPVLSLNWINWRERLDRAQRGEDARYKFNLDSPMQLADLLYTRLGYTPTLFTDGGLPSTSSRALRSVGEIGEILIHREELTKELSYIDKYLEITTDRNTIHPNFRLPGTSTGRLSSNNINMQQIKKSIDVMGLFRAREGHVWVDSDFSALESMVVTEFSRDENMMRLYANDAPENDIHLFVAAHIPGLKEAILATGYDPYNPNSETVAIAKKECKYQRSLAKTTVYACQYGAGVNKVYNSLVADGVDVTYDQVETVHSTYWELFSGIRKFSDELFRQWRSNRGYILNGFGRPMCVTRDYTKDLLSRFIQSTGHDILVLYIDLYTAELDRRGIPWRPLVVDWHDSTAIEVEKQYALRVVDVYNWAMDELNLRLGGLIRLKGNPVVGTNMAEIKEVG